jgi:hypothetical protein
MIGANVGCFGAEDFEVVPSGAHAGFLKEVFCWKKFGDLTRKIVLLRGEFILGGRF